MIVSLWHSYIDHYIFKPWLKSKIWTSFTKRKHHCSATFRLNSKTDALWDCSEKTEQENPRYSTSSQVLFSPSRKHKYKWFNPFKRERILSDIYMVPEEFSFPNVSIETYVKTLLPLYSSFDNEKINRIFTEFELEPKAGINKLSHGQRKKFLMPLPWQPTVKCWCSRWTN